jgi:hypothetical protein
MKDKETSRWTQRRYKQILEWNQERYKKNQIKKAKQDVKE